MTAKNRFKTLLTVYGTLPFIVTALIIIAEQESSIWMLPQLLTAAFQALLIPVILGIRKQKPAFSIFTLFILFTVLFSLLLSRFQNSLYLIMLLKYYPGPALTLAYTLIFRFSRFREMETMERSIKFFLLLLLSYMLMSLMISVYRSVQSNTEVLLLPDILEILNYIPALFLLNRLAVSCRKELTVTETSIIYHNTDYTSLLNELQLNILKKLCSSSTVRCRDFAASGTDCPEDDYCKATQCAEYNRIYRNVQELGKKLKNLGLGEIHPPQNKRDVVSKGWKLDLYEGIVIKKRKKPPVIASIKADFINADGSPAVPAEKKLFGEKTIMTPYGFIVLLAGTIYLSLNIIQPLTTAGLPLFFITLTAELCIFLMPFIFSRLSRFKTGLLIFILVLFTAFLLSLSFLNEYFAFLLLVEHYSMFMLLLMLNLKCWERSIHITHFRAQASTILFWSVWFYMAASTIVTDIYILSPAFMKVLDKTFMYSFMVTAVLFHSLPRKKLEISGKELFINSKLLPDGLSEINREILLRFLQADPKIQKCRELLKLTENDEQTGCDQLCKSSACKPYKRLYKRILSIRNYLESNGLGTIKNTERSAASNAEPEWVLQLHEDIFQPPE